MTLCQQSPSVIGPLKLAIAGAAKRSMTVCGSPTSRTWLEVSGGGAASRRHPLFSDQVGPSGQYRGAVERRQSQARVRSANFHGQA